MTPEKLDEIERGLEGVTPGPWRSSACVVETLDPNYGNGTSGWRKPGSSIAHLDDGEYIENPNAEADAAHIARLDPTTVAELVRLARIGLRSERARAAGEKEMNHAQDQ